MGRALLGDMPAVPSQAVCIDMLREISEEAYALPHFRPAPDLTVRYYTVRHWLLERTAFPPKVAAELVDEPSTAAVVGMGAWEMANTLAAAGRIGQ